MGEGEGEGEGEEKMFPIVSDVHEAYSMKWWVE